MDNKLEELKRNLQRAGINKLYLVNITYPYDEEVAAHSVYFTREAADKAANKIEEIQEREKEEDGADYSTSVEPILLSPAEDQFGAYIGIYSLTGYRKGEFGGYWSFWRGPDEETFSTKHSIRSYGRTLEETEKKAREYLEQNMPEKLKELSS